MMGDMRELVDKYWDELPHEMRVEMIANNCKQREIVEFAARELGIDMEFERRGNLSKSELTEFVLQVMEIHGDIPEVEAP